MCSVGVKVKTDNYGYFTVLKELGGEFLVEFDNTKYRTVVSLRRIRDGKVKDRMAKTILGVACIGTATKKDNEKEYRLWYTMITRCYNENHPSYELYGELGVKVHHRWLVFSEFLKDIPNIEVVESDGCNGSLELDKDFKQMEVPINERIYSLETCAFVSKDINQMNRSCSIRFNAHSVGGEVVSGTTMEEWIKYNPNHKPRTIYTRLKEPPKEYMGWFFEKV